MESGRRGGEREGREREGGGKEGGKEGREGGRRRRKAIEGGLGVLRSDVSICNRVLVAEVGGVGPNRSYPLILLLLSPRIKHILSVIVGLCVCVCVWMDGWMKRSDAEGLLPQLTSTLSHAKEQLPHILCSFILQYHIPPLSDAFLYVATS